MSKNYNQHSYYKEITHNNKNWKNAFIILDSFSETNLLSFRNKKIFNNISTIIAIQWFEFCKNNKIFKMSLDSYKKAWYCICFWKKNPIGFNGFTHFVHSIIGNDVFGNSNIRFNAFSIGNTLGDYKNTYVDLSYTPFFSEKSTYKSEIQGKHFISFEELKKLILI